jgi:two-component system chemotaxis response regulator CheB
MIAPRPIRVLIVDDSAMVRKVLSLGFAADPGIEVLGAASNADAAWDLMQRHRPDVITLDVEMPKIDGLTFLRQFLPRMPIPTVMISSLTRQGAAITMQAMEAGAVDVISKPSLGLATGLPAIMADICARVRAAATARVSVGRLRRAAADAPHPAMPHRAQAGILAIGSSTGGVQALSTILPSFPPNAPGIVIVQHMPEGFTGPFAARLDSLCDLAVREARHGDVLEPGMVLVAPGGSRHMTVARHGRTFRVSLIDGDPVCFSRPSVDVLFASVARAAGAQATAAILTGMGRDGAQGLLAIRRAGGQTFAQDESTSVVYGMPMAARDIGAAAHVLPLEEIPARMLQAAATQGVIRA